MNDHIIMDFLRELEQNNNRTWMQEHKAYQKEAAARFERLLQDIIGELVPYDPSIAQLNAKALVFRQNRDTRFSSDKSPYNPSFRAHISSAGRAPVPVGYYIHISPGNSFLGGGLFASMFKDATEMIRAYIVKHGQEFEDIINAPQFREHFTLSGEKLKNVPRGYDPEFPQSAYLKHKSWYIEQPVADGALNDLAAFTNTAVESFLRMRPFNRYINTALAGFTMPERPGR